MSKNKQEIRERLINSMEPHIRKIRQDASYSDLAFAFGIVMRRIVFSDEHARPKKYRVHGKPTPPDVNTQFNNWPTGDALPGGIRPGA